MGRLSYLDDSLLLLRAFPLDNKLIMSREQFSANVGHFDTVHNGGTARLVTMCLRYWRWTTNYLIHLPNNVFPRWTLTFHKRQHRKHQRCKQLGRLRGQIRLLEIDILKKK